MDAVVTARVPVEIKEQGNTLLRNMGSSPTELINEAYRYVLKHGKLPSSRDGAAPSEPTARRLTPKQRANLRASLAAMTLPIPHDDGRSFESMLADARDERYAYLS